MRLNEIVEDPDAPLIWDLVQQKLESKIPVDVVYNGKSLGPLAVLGRDHVGNYVIYWNNSVGAVTSTAFNEKALSNCTLKKVDGKLQLNITWNSPKIPRRMTEAAYDDPDTPFIWDMLLARVESGKPVHLSGGMLSGDGPRLITHLRVVPDPIRTTEKSYVIDWVDEKYREHANSFLEHHLATFSLKKTGDGWNLDITGKPMRMAEEIEDADLPIVYDLIRAKLKTGTVIDMVQAQLPKAKIKRRITSLEAFAPDRVELFWEWTEKKDTDWFYPKVATCDYSVEDMERWQLSKTPTGWNLDMRETK